MRCGFGKTLAPLLLVQCANNAEPVDAGALGTSPVGDAAAAADSTHGSVPQIVDAASVIEDAGSSAPPLDSGGDAQGGDSAAADGSVSLRADASGCGVRTGMRGLTSRTVAVSGSNRTYLVYLPQALNPLTPVPLVFVFHGAAMSGQIMHDLTQFGALADSLQAEGFGVVFPDGQGGPGTLTPWNVADQGQSVCGAGNLVNNANAVDFAFIDAMEADIAQDQCLDAAHLFATGFSMGGYFSHHIGCEKAGFRAVAPASGGTLADLSSCTTAHVPIIIFHGTSDALIADGCDDPNGAAQSGFPPSASLWAKKNGCQDTFTVITENGVDGGGGQCYLYAGCPSDGQVELCTFTGMGHAWAGGSTVGQAGSFAAPGYASATQLAWDFFKKYAW